MASLFENLLELHPNVDKLLELQVNELAGALLLSIKTKGQHNAEYDTRKAVSAKNEFKPVDEITYRALDLAIKQKADTEMHASNELLYALMEATQFLINHGFLAQTPTQTQKSTGIYSIPTYFPTRKAEAIDTMQEWEIWSKKSLR